jgi:preprotein translocase subunit SecA
MRAMLRALFGKSPAVPAGLSSGVSEVNRLRSEYSRLSDSQLKEQDLRATTLHESVAVTAVAAARTLGLEMFDSQIACALGLAGGTVVEMPTGEGKTLAAVPAIVWLARGGSGVHVLTANDYLARRDAAWMRPVYEWHAVSVSAIQQSMTTAERRAAYRTDVTYATANEVGFDYLRDGLALDPAEQVHRELAAAVIDEADSILIDEARAPLVIAGGDSQSVGSKDAWPFLADQAVRSLALGHDFTIDTNARNAALTPAGIARVEASLGRADLFRASGRDALAAVQDALHAHAFLRRDIDYVVSNGTVLSVDEFKGRVAPDRRWPAGLQTAIECKEGVRPRPQGRVLGSITVENLIGLYPFVAGMTGTAATEAGQFRSIYGLDVSVVLPHRPVIREDRPDRGFATRAEKDAAVVDEIRRAHATGQPVLVGTESVQASERLSRALGDLPHSVLNARNEEAEAAIIARAGERGAVTISTNMAGRGVDIRLGAGVAELGGLFVIGMHRHESRRIDHQLRGRSGRQGDPGASQFFVSGEDPLIAKYAEGDPKVSADQCQRIAEGQNLDIRLFLRKYESAIEGQRQKISALRQQVLADDPAGSDGRVPDSAERTARLETRGERTARLETRGERTARLETIDELWSDYLAASAEARSGTTWTSLGYGRPFDQYLAQIHGMFQEMEASIDDETAARLERHHNAPPRERGATWTYITTDEPFGPATERVMRGLVRMIKQLNR